MHTTSDLTNEAMDVSNLYVFQHPDGAKYDYSTVTSLSAALSSPNLTIQQITKWQVQASEVYLYYYMKSRDCPQHIQPASVILDAGGDIIHHSMSHKRQPHTVLNELVYMNSMARIHSTMMEYVERPQSGTTESHALYTFNLIATYMYAAAVSETDVCGAATLRTMAHCMDMMAKNSAFADLAQVLATQGCGSTAVSQQPTQSSKQQCDSESPSSGCSSGSYFPEIPVSTYFREVYEDTNLGKGTPQVSNNTFAKPSGETQTELGSKEIENWAQSVEFGTKLSAADYPQQVQLRCNSVQALTARNLERLAPGQAGKTN